jgi:hypothetical protein
VVPLKSVRRLKGKVVAFEKTGSVKLNDENWERCIFTLELTRFSGRNPTEPMPPVLRGKIIKIVRYCLYDWHYKAGVEKTLEPEETEAVISGKPCETAYW